MNSFENILVHLDDSLSGEKRLELARQVAQIRTQQTSSHSHIEAVYATPPSHLSSAMPYSEYSMRSFTRRMDDDAKRRNETKALFDQWVQTPGPAIVWHERSAELPRVSLVNRSLFADLVVLGQFNAVDPGMADETKHLNSNLIIDSGKPALILPFIGSMSSTLQNIMIAWNPSRESSRALAAAIPFLQNAKSIHLIADIPNLDSDDLQGSLERYLRSNGITVKPTFESSSGLNAVGELILSRAVDVGADLLVMGCYGHSRAREFVIGGASRTILESMTLPTLMVH
jgi:nucleotide-binding universal stress UspA family protein